MNIKLGNIKSQKYDESYQSELMKKIKDAVLFIDIEDNFNQLYDSITKPLWNSLLKKYVPPLTQEDLKDVFQEAWIKVIDSRKSFDESKKAYTWIYTIFKNLTIDKLRFIDRKKTQSIDSDDDADTKKDFKVDNSYEADFATLNNETLKFINSAIESLSDDIEKNIVIKRIIENKKFEDIGKDLDLPIATVHYKLNKALGKLRTKLEFLNN